MERDRYDVVVIGAGVGGMCAAALLAHAGYKTLILEKLPAIGGRCSSVEYKGFTISTGAITLPVEGGPIEGTFEQVGAEYPVRRIPKDILIHYRVRGEAYLLSPEEGFRGLLSFACKEKRDVEAVIGAIERGASWLEPSPLISARDWLLQYTQSEVILEVFQALIVNHFNVNLWEMPASEFVRYFKPKQPQLLTPRGFAPNGNLAVWESLAKAIRRDGGQIWTRCPARRIMVADHKVKGVIVDKQGEELEIAAKAVISNAGPKKTVELAGSESFDKGYLTELRQKLRPAPCILIHFATPEDKPLIEQVRLYTTGTRRLAAVRWLTKICPELAPPGKHLFYASGQTGSSLPPIDFKKDVEFHLLDLKENLPGFDRYAEIIKVGCFFGDWPLFRTWAGHDLPQKTPVENLYNVGDGVKPLGWASVAAPAETARIVVEDIKERMEPGKS